MELSEKIFKTLKNTLEKGERFFLIVHPNPDADALGSAFSLKEYLILKNKKVKVYSLNQPSDTLKKLFSGQKISISRSDLESFDFWVFLDRGDVFSKSGFKEVFQKIPDSKKPTLINIDHHPDTSFEPALNLCDSKSSATCEIIYNFFKEINFKITAQTAQFLLSGIYTDTGGFRHNNTTPEALEIAGLLMKKGASIAKINRTLFCNKDLSTLKLWAIALERAKINEKTGMAVSFITEQDLKENHATIDDLSGIPEILNTISGSKFSLVLTQSKPGTIKASLRSEEYKKVDVSQIAKQFMGGGHKLSSGFEIKGNLKQIGKDWIIE